MRNMYCLTCKREMVLTGSTETLELVNGPLEVQIHICPSCLQKVGVLP